MPHNKTILISRKYGIPYDQLVKKFYSDEKMPAVTIAQKFFADSGISVSPRQIHYDIKRLGISRPKSEAFRLAIQTGRKTYKHLKKTLKSRDIRRGISPGTRYVVLKRDNFRCVLCGQGPQETVLTIDHILPVLHGGTNDINNLRALCTDCNTGKMIAEHEK